MILITIDLIVLFVAILTGFAVLRKKDPQHIVLFPYFLLLVLLVEYTSATIQKRHPGQSTVLLFNLFAAAEFAFFIYFFSRAMPNEKTKNIIRKTGYILPAACLINAFFIQGLYVFNTFTFMAGCLSMVILSVIYYYQLFNQATDTNRLREPSFWIITGIIFFFVCTVSVMGAVNYISLLPAVVRENLHRILLLVNAIFYLTFIIAFLCQINIRKLSSSSS
ncbi:MAG: hypothetical protein V4539_16800 [Bacteroidota bacterium]